MDTKARVAVLAGGLVLVGMVAWVLMPAGTSTEPQDVATETDDLALVPFDSSNSAQVDPFAAPTTAPSAPSVTSLDGALPNPGVMDVVPGATATNTATVPQPTVPLAMNNVGVGPSVPQTSSDTWGRAFEQNTSATVSAPGTSFTTSSSFDTTAAMGSLSSSASVAPAVTSAMTSSAGQTYKVASGDSLYTISQKLYGTPKQVNAILSANPGLNPKRLKVGQTLKLPDVTGSPASSITSTSLSAPVSLMSTSSAKTYKVQAGDTLNKIAKVAYGQSSAWEKIYSANKSAIGSDPSRLKVGMVLQLP